MAIFAKFFPWGWTCLVHFLVVEMRALYLFYGSVKSFTTKIAISAEMQRQLGGGSGSEDWTELCVHDHDIDDLLTCVKRGVKEALWTLWISDEYDHGCYRRDEPGFSYVGALHLSALVACGLFLLMCLGLLLKSNCTDWRAGNYLYFTWELEHRKSYKLGAGLLLAYTAVYLAWILLACFDVIHTHHLFLSPEKLLQLAWADMFGLISGAYAFSTTKDPPFNWEESALLSCTFYGRPWWNLVKNSNNAFGEELEHAILKARLCQPKELEELLGREYDGPLTRAMTQGNLVHARVSDGDVKLFCALGAIDPPPVEKEEMRSVEAPKSNFWNCAGGGGATSGQRDALLSVE